jgi:hypothetical protein
MGNTQTLPSHVLPTDSRNRVDSSPVRYEVVRMISDGMSYEQISANLKSFFGVDFGVSTIAEFKKGWYPYYEELIDKWDKSRYPSLIAKLSTAVKERAQNLAQEVVELQKMIQLIDDRIKEIQDNKESSIGHERVLNDYIKTKAALLERATKLVGASGLEGKLKNVVKQTALAAQRSLIPYLKEEDKAKAFALFEQEISSILNNIEAGF